jgi:thiamine biosynthesis protein ThiS
MVHLTINGDPYTLDEPVTIAAFLTLRGLASRMVVVERNREIVPRDRYADTLLHAGDTLEIVQMMAGG